MKILFTGGSSFTGHWFIRELAHAGHEIVAIFRSPPDGYEGIRRERVARLQGLSRGVFGCAFGDPGFLDLIEAEDGWDAFCHHAADVTDYKSPDFDVMAAVASNTRNLSSVLEALARRGCRTVLLTGSVFENDEGAGSEGLPAFSPYGLSKGLTAQVFRYCASVAATRFGKFVIPNPFGPFEEPRFTSYLVQSWYKGQTPSVTTPAYVRDNIHVSLLAKVYARFLERLVDGAGPEKINPSGYAESQGAFARRLAEEMRERLDLPCELHLGRQTQFLEPRVRINTDVPDVEGMGWSEVQAWDELADYYRHTFG
jgi:nucleoside-diphosphate-sugar epimerase